MTYSSTVFKQQRNTIQNMEAGRGDYPLRYVIVLPFQFEDSNSVYSMSLVYTDLSIVFVLCCVSLCSNVIFSFTTVIIAGNEENAVIRKCRCRIIVYSTEQRFPKYIYCISFSSAECDRRQRG